jgi:hypothetical protein
MERKLIALAIVTSLGLVALADGCTGEQWTGSNSVCCPTDPKDPVWDDPICVEGREWDAYRKDAGIDGAGCSPPNYPASEQQSDEAVESVCVPNAPNDFDPPQPLWVGPKEEDPGCVPEIGAFGGREYNDLDVPDPGCPACVCGPIDGSCSPRPNSILIRADYCEALETYTTDFSAPENWDGSCTNINAMPPGAECPVGSGNLCTQSIYTSSLLDPVEKCEPIPMPVPKARADIASSSVPTANAHSDLPTWSTHVLSCNATPIDLACPDHDSKRFAVLPKDWRRCVRHRDKGIYECPSGSKYKDQVIAYSDTGYTDTRQCTKCGCKASGGTCYGTFNVYEDDQCTKFVDMATLYSDTYGCSNVAAGVGVGSKELVDLTYLPGECKPTGGLAIGTVEKDDAEAVTWCCM